MTKGIAARTIAATYERVILALLILQYACSVLAMTPSSYDFNILKHLLPPAFSLLILALWMIGDVCRSGRWTLPRHAFTTVSVGLLLYWAALTYISPLAHASVMEWIAMFSFFVAAWALIRFVETERALRTMVLAVFACAALTIPYGCSQIMGFDPLVRCGIFPDMGESVLTSTLGCPNSFAGYLLTVLPLLAGGAIVTANHRARVIGVLLMFLGLFDILHPDRNPWVLALLVIAPIAFTGLLAWRLRHGAAATRRRAVIAIVLVGATALAPMYLLNGGAITRILADDRVKGEADDEPLTSIRSEMHRTGLDLGLSAPLIGHGLGTFTALMPEARPADYHRRGMSHGLDSAYNIVLNWFAATGVFGASGFLLLIAVSISSSLRCMRRHPGSRLFPLAFTAILGPVALWIVSLFCWPFCEIDNAVPLWFGVGLALAAARIAVAESEPAQEGEAIEGDAGGRSMPVVAAACLILAATGLYVVQAHDLWLADARKRSALENFDSDAESRERALRDGEEARRLDAFDPRNQWRLAYSALAANDSIAALRTYREIQALAPNVFQIHSNLASLDDTFGFRTAAAWERDRAAEIEENTLNHREAAREWSALGCPNRALAHLHRALAIDLDRDGDDWDCRLWLHHDDVLVEIARIETTIGRRREAEDELAGVLRMNPDHPALLALRMSRAVAAHRFAEGIGFAEEAGRRLYIPSGDPDPAVAALGNAMLADLQRIFAETKKDPEIQNRCLAITGWIYATQGRYDEADRFLMKAYETSRDSETARRIGDVRARIKP